MIGQQQRASTLSFVLLLVLIVGQLHNPNQRAKLPLCEETSRSVNVTSYARGKWVLGGGNHSHAKSFVCCSRNVSVTPNPETCSTMPTSKWLNIITNNLNLQCGDECCGCDDEDHTRFTSSLREQYEWHPHNCRLPLWSAAEFCHVLRNRTLLILGDSTMEQSFVTLTSLLTADLAGGAACVKQVLYGWSSHLMTSTFPNNVPDYLAQVSPDIVVLAAGAHFQDHGDLKVVLDLLETELKPWYAKVPLFIWKSQNPPHVGCDWHHAPLNEGHEYSPAELAEIKYNNWNLFPSFDAYARSRAVANGWRFLDMSPLYLRPDGHSRGSKKDCLHFCLPGPLNLFAQLLLHLLLE